jgi:hypothetical protein
MFVFRVAIQGNKLEAISSSPQSLTDEIFAAISTVLYTELNVHNVSLFNDPSGLKSTVSIIEFHFISLHCVL